MTKMYSSSGKYITKIFTLSLICLVVAGCGADEDDNTQPALEAIADRTVDVGDRLSVEISINDADVDDSHTIRASSDDRAIATVSVTDTALIVKGIADGTTTITVNVTDDSGQENAAATAIVFQVTVDANVQPIIEAIADRTVDVGDETSVEININDADVDDTHTIRASADDRAIATVSVTNTTLTVKGIADGATTITVNVTDDSGQENAAAAPVTFEVTIRGNTVPGDPSFSDLVEAWGNDALVDAIFDRATRLRVGLEFPRDTFAINEERTILVAHTPEGTGLVLVGGARFEAGGGIQLGWLTFEKRGDVRVLTHYNP